MAHGAAASFRLDEIRGIAVDVEANVASVELDDVFQLHGRVVYENFCLLDGVSGGQGLFCAYAVERDKHCGVNGACNVEEGAGNNLHACDDAFIKAWCGSGIKKALHFGPVRWREPLVGRVLGAHGCRVLEVLQGFADSVGH